MKVGEVWKAISKEREKFAPWDRHPLLIKLTRLYRDDIEMQDYVEYVALEDDMEPVPIGGGITREEFLKCYKRVDNV